jgi:DNA mismatch repair protein MSH5
VALELSKQYPYIHHLTVIYFPQLGYLISLAIGNNIQDYERAGFVFQFSTESSAFYKSDKMRELDETMGDVHSIIAGTLDTFFKITIRL